MRRKPEYLMYFFWWLGIIKNCPQCKSKLIKIDKGGWDLYKCSNPECDFGKRRQRWQFEIWKR